MLFETESEYYEAKEIRNKVTLLEDYQDDLGLRRLRMERDLLELMKGKSFGSETAYIAHLFRHAYAHFCKRRGVEDTSENFGTILSNLQLVESANLTYPKNIEEYCKELRTKYVWDRENEYFYISHSGKYDLDKMIEQVFDEDYEYSERVIKEFESTI